MITSKAIVFQTVKFQDNHLIVKCFTEIDGLKSYFVRGVLGSKKGQSKRAMFQPLSLLEIEAQHKNKGQLEYFKEVKLAYPYQTIPFDVQKSSILLFLSEVLHQSIKETENPNPTLFQYIYTQLCWFDQTDSFSHFHLTFLLQLTKYLGFYPSEENLQNPYFEMIEGVFITEETLSCLTLKHTNLVKKLLETPAQITHKTFSNAEKKWLLHFLMEYYALHSEGFYKPKSLEILAEVYS